MTTERKDIAALAQAQECWRHVPGLPTYVEFRPGGDSIGSPLLGELTASYADIVAAFGEPWRPNGDGYKVDVCWVLTFRTFGRFESVATIYNYKDGPSYEEGAPHPKDRPDVDWHIGGKESFVFGWVANVLLHRQRQKGGA
jgi:hypothetical protein